MKKVWIVVALLCLSPCWVALGRSMGSNGKPLSETVGITHAGISYTHDSSVSCMRDGADQILKLGSKVIKLWFADDPVGAYSVNCNWDQFTINNSLDLIQTDYYREVLEMDFTTFVLEAHTFDKAYNDSNVRWDDGMSQEECDRIEREMFELTEYLMLEYNGTGKEFVLQNWEGDNMLGGRFWRLDEINNLYYAVDDGKESANQQTDLMVRTRVRGLTDWFNYRQKGVDRAREKYKLLSDVQVRHALEINFVYLDSRDDGWPYIDSPTLLKDIVPYTNCDLYSLSCWGSLTIERAHTLRDRLVMYRDAIGDTFVDIYDRNQKKDRRPYVRDDQVSFLMLGEYGAIERFQQTETGGWGPDLNYVTDMRHREVLQIQTELALDLGLEFVVYWELYCNVPRVDTEPPMVIDNRIGELARSNDQMQGNWLIRVDGSYTEGYKYIYGLLDPDKGTYIVETYSPNRIYKINDIYSGFEVAGELNSSHMLSNLSTEKTFGNEIQVWGSIDGVNYNKIETEAYFTQCVEESGFYRAKIIYINRERPCEEYRFFKIKKMPGERNVTLSTVKLYKPNL